MSIIALLWDVNKETQSNLSLKKTVLVIIVYCKLVYISLSQLQSIIKSIRNLSEQIFPIYFIYNYNFQNIILKSIHDQFWSLFLIKQAKLNVVLLNNFTTNM